MQAKRVALRFLLFAFLGLLMEVFFTGLSANDWNMRGHSSPWMMLDYGLLGVVLMPIARPLQRRKIPLVFRAGVYMVGIFVVEYISGRLFTACGLRIWNYSKLPYNLHGQITLTFVPYWYGVGLGVEWLYAKVDAVALLLLHRLDATDIDAMALRKAEVE